MKLLKIWLAFIAVITLSACGKTQNNSQSPNKLQNVSLILDYVPNTNHTGIYVAQDKGYFKKAGLNVKIIEPGDNTTSTGMVGAKKAQFGVSYQEDVTYAHSNGKNIPIKAIATIVQHNTSGFVSLKSSNITSPQDFANKTYAGWQSPSEEAVLKSVMKNAHVNPHSLKIIGANGSAPGNLGQKNDLQWWFEGWDVVKAHDAKMKINYLPLRQLDKRLDYYTPVIITNQSEIQQHPQLVKAFLAATKKGYQYSIKHPQASAKILHKHAPNYNLNFLKESQNFLSKNYTDNPQKWGLMQEQVWNNYTDFMHENGLIKHAIPAHKLYTNQYLDK